ncbi:hypothetical protein NJL88_05375 [Streptomyces sp. DK15]|uniref:hypothetical protein n=1 Tax=Streptomyces sp. DK15 TaxID=2957499 RepID=UPI0029ABCC15|nr:hypothetical protein [Streptomyces sp. DK15]MDX2389503.1 hypothetical protein [Streptomyces sp. DK15]
MVALLLELEFQVDHLLFEGGDRGFELFSVLGAAYAGLTPDLLAQDFAEPHFAAAGVGGEAGAAGVCCCLHRRAVGAAPNSSVMSNYQRPQPNRKLVWAVYPAGTHLDRSRASSGGMRATARNDRDNSLVTQAELFDADDRYDDGYDLRNLLVNCAASIAVDVARAVTATALEVATPYVKDGARRFKEKLRRTPKDTPAAEVVPEAAPERPTASGLRPVTAAADGRDQVDLVLRADQGDANAQAALERINTRAVETYCIAAHYLAGLPAADVSDEAMRQALAAAAPGYVAAALERLAFDDDALGLTPAQRMRLLHRAAELDPGVIEDLTGAHTPLG